MSRLHSGDRCHILGGASELQRLLEEVRKLKRGYPSDLPEFFGFANWNEVVAFTALPEGEHLKTFVKLVNDHGEDKILGAVRQCEQNEETADVTLSTAHKAKGREWDTVLLDNDFDSPFTKLLQPELSNRAKFSNRYFESEMRLLYVAMTRAKLAVELPPTVMQFFGLQHTRNERFGKPRRIPTAPFPRVGVRVAVKSPNQRYYPPTPPAAQQSNQRPRGLFGLIRALFR
jgi:UvrD-like helicase C-terminal domain